MQESVEQQQQEKEDDWAATVLTFLLLSPRAPGVERGRQRPASLGNRCALRCRYLCPVVGDHANMGWSPQTRAAVRGSAVGTTNHEALQTR